MWRTSLAGEGLRNEVTVSAGSAGDPGRLVAAGGFTV
jgi:hypothetical protein